MYCIIVSNLERGVNHPPKAKTVNNHRKTLRFQDRWVKATIDAYINLTFVEESKMSNSEKTIAVVGAGITGITTAYSLLQRGFNVTVFDRNRYAAMETSYANGGQLSASNAEVWNKWSTVFKGMKWMFAPGAPLLINPMPSFHKYSWMAEFMAAIPHYEKNTIETVRLAISARPHLKDHADREGFDFDCENRGILHVFTDPKEFEAAKKVNDLYAKGGLERHAITPDEARKIEPAIQAELAGACFTPSDFTGDIHRYSVGLSEACARRGVEFHYRSKITSIDHKGDTIELSWTDKDEAMLTKNFDNVVICAGVGSRKLANMLGDRVNIYPVKGYSITVDLDDEESQKAAPWVSLLDDEAKLVLSRLGKDRLRIAGTAEFNGYNLNIRDDRIKPITKWCERFFPNVATEKVIPWAGLRPMMPSMLPRVGAGKKPGVFYNTGHGHLGWTLSAATAELVAEQVLLDMQSSS
jgi:D-amino-acid dehydrogenase